MAGLFDLGGRVVVVTGGLGQLGRAFAAALVEHGARVAVVDVPAAGHRFAEAFPGVGEDRLRFHGADVTSRADQERVLAEITAAWDVPYGLVNNAAIDSPPNAPATENGPLETYPDSSFDRIMSVNVKGPLVCAQVFGGAMAEAGRGSIVNIGSIYGILSPDQKIYQYRRDRGEVFFKPIAYSVSKSAIMNMTRYMAVYWGDRSVRVNTLVFSGVFNNQEEAFLKGYLPKVPLGRMADPGDYIGPIVYLMSDASRYQTGSDMTVDGGFAAM